MKRRTIASVLLIAATVACAQTKPADHYTTGTATPDGIGKFYLGREIAQVMGHAGASWLERDTREAEERTDKLIELLEVKPTDVVADIGAGTGYFSFRLAPKAKRVIAEDIEQAMIDDVERAKRERKVTNVETILGTTTDPKLPAGGVDLVLMVDAYHEFDQPFEMMQKIAASLGKNGRVALVEYRGEDPDVPIKPLHKMTIAQATREMANVGLKLLSTRDELPMQHVMFFGRE